MRRLLPLILIAYMVLCWALLLRELYTVGATFGVSMYKTFGEASIVLVRRVDMTEGKAASLKTPFCAIIDYNYQGRDELLCKWVVKIAGNKAWFEGEHPLSLSSRDVGWISIYQIKGIVVWHAVLRPLSYKEVIELKVIKLEEELLRQEAIPDGYLHRKSANLRENILS